MKSNKFPLGLAASLEKCELKATRILSHGINFPIGVDCSIFHGKRVFEYLRKILDENAKALNYDELYMLNLSIYFHEIALALSLKDVTKENSHLYSADYIRKEWYNIGIINEQYAEGIARIIKGHREESLYTLAKENVHYIVKSGTEFVCLPFLSALLKLGINLDITRERILWDVVNSYSFKKEDNEQWRDYENNLHINFKEKSILLTCKDSRSNVSKQQIRNLEVLLDQIHVLLRNLKNEGREFSMPYQFVELYSRGF